MNPKAFSSLYHPLVSSEKATAPSRSCIRSVSTPTHLEKFCCLGPWPSGIWHIHNILWLRCLWKSSSGAEALWLCEAEFSWRSLSCPAPWCSLELSCWYIYAQFNTFQILALIPHIQISSLVSHPSYHFGLFDQYELWECLGFGAL